MRANLQSAGRNPSTQGRFGDRQSLHLKQAHRLALCFGKCCERSRQLRRQIRRLPVGGLAGVRPLFDDEFDFAVATALPLAEVIDDRVAHDRPHPRTERSFTSIGGTTSMDRKERILNDILRRRSVVDLPANNRTNLWLDGRQQISVGRGVAVLGGPHPFRELPLDVVRWTFLMLVLRQIPRCLTWLRPKIQGGDKS